MKRVLVKCGWLVDARPKIGEIKGGDLLYNGNTIEPWAATSAPVRTR